MKAQWQAWSEQLSEREPREKYLILGVGIFLIGYLLAWFAIFPMMDENSKLQKRVQDTERAIAQLENQQKFTTIALEGEYGRAEKQTIAKLTENIQELDDLLAQITENYVPPTQMPEVLTRLLKEEASLTLVALQQLPVTPVTIEVAEKDTVKEQVVFYQHSVAIKAKGGYFALQNYIKRLQAIDAALQIDQLAYKVLEYPQAELTLTISTVSADERYLAL